MTCQKIRLWQRFLLAEILRLQHWLLFTVYVWWHLLWFCMNDKKGYGLLNIRFRSTFSLQYGHICFLPTMHQPLMQNSWNLGLELRKQENWAAATREKGSNITERVENLRRRDSPPNRNYLMSDNLVKGTGPVKRTANNMTMQQTTVVGEVILIEALVFSVLLYNLKVTILAQFPSHCWLSQAQQKQIHFDRRSFLHS